jgi:hypothetical protein
MFGIKRKLHVKDVLLEFKPYATFFLLFAFWRSLNLILERFISGFENMWYLSGVFNHTRQIEGLRASMNVYGVIVIFYFTIFNHYFKKIIFKLGSSQ